MSLPPPRTPPRFVPTLTEVVQVPEALPGMGVPAGAGAPRAAASLSDPVSGRAAPAPPASRPPFAPPPSAALAAVPTVPAPATAPSQNLPFSARPHLPSARPPAVMMPRTGLAGDAASGTVAKPPPALAPRAPQVASSTTLPSAPAAGPAPLEQGRPLPDGMEEYVVHRVMQRVDVVLDQRLRDAIATVVQEQTRSVLPRLREEIESVVRNAVYEAVAEELASGGAHRPQG